MTVHKIKNIKTNGKTKTALLTLGTAFTGLAVVTGTSENYLGCMFFIVWGIAVLAVRERYFK